MKITLIAYKRKKRRMEFVITRPETVIGRSADCDLHLNDSRVSRQHCKLVFSNGILKVIDLSSARGTYVNRRRVQEAELTDGDRLSIGRIYFRVRFVSTLTGNGEKSADGAKIETPAAPLESNPSGAIQPAAKEAAFTDLENTMKKSDRTPDVGHEDKHPQREKSAADIHASREKGRSARRSARPSKGAGKEDSGRTRKPGGEIVRREEASSMLLPVAPPPGDIFAPVVAPDSADKPPQHSIRGILRYKWTLLAVFVLVAAPAITAIWVLIDPLYQARAEVRVRPIIPHIVFKTENSGMIPLYQSFMNTQVSIIRSPTVLARALDQEDVQQTNWYKDPQQSLLRQSGDPPERLREALSVKPRPRTEIIDVALTTRIAGDAKIIVDAVLDQYIIYISEMSDETRDQIDQQLSEQYKTLEREISGRKDILAKLRKELGTGTPDELVSRKRIRLDETEAGLDKLLREISLLEWQQRYQYTRNVSEMPDDARHELDRRLTKQYETLKDKISDCEKSLTKLRKDTNTGDVAEKVSNEKDRLSILKRKLAEVEWQQKVLKEVMTKIVKEGKTPTTQAAPSRPTYQKDAEWRRLDIAVKISRHKVETARRQFKDSHPKMIDLINELKLADELLRLRETQLDQQWRTRPNLPLANGGTSPGYGADENAVHHHLNLLILRHQEKLLLEEAKKQKADSDKTFHSAQMLEEESEAIRHKRRLFKAVRERLDQKKMERNVPGSIKVLTRAFAPSKPSKDRRLVFTFMALAGALGLGVATAFLRANKSQAMHGAEDLPASYQTPFLGLLPLVKSKRWAFEDDPVLIENVRMVRTSLLSRIDEQHGNAVLISSAGAGTGKTTVAIMLARSLAQCGKKVLLVDADLRKPNLSKHFGLDAEHGFIESMTGKTANRRVIFATDMPRLSVMPIGQRVEDADIELMANGALTACVDRWRKNYDIMLLDSSPILPVADARILSGHMDGTIMVVRQEKCQREDVIDALAYLGSSGGKLLGTIFIGSPRRGNYQYDYYNSIEK